MIKLVKQLAKVALKRAVIVDIVPPIEFVGWKMATGTHAPWEGGGSNRIAIEFAQCDGELERHLASSRIILSQFRRKSVAIEVAQLRWRHYLVYWTAAVAAQLSMGVDKNFVEMGVCDGLTAWYASHARQRAQCGGEFFLYDAWEEMRTDLLTDSEVGSAGSYAYLDIENTRKNLSLCTNETFVFNKGYIPESFSNSQNPQSIAWMHIDLNSSIPTIASLDYFWNKLLPRGLILLDDFAWPGYEETKTAVEEWCEARNFDILQFPTGQGLIIKQ